MKAILLVTGKPSVASVSMVNDAREDGYGLADAAHLSDAMKGIGKMLGLAEYDILMGIDPHNPDTLPDLWQTTAGNFAVVFRVRGDDDLRVYIDSRRHALTDSGLADFLTSIGGPRWATGFDPITVESFSPAAWYKAGVKGDPVLMAY